MGLAHPGPPLDPPLLVLMQAVKIEDLRHAGNKILFFVEINLFALMIKFLNFVNIELSPCIQVNSLMRTVCIDTQKMMYFSLVKMFSTHFVL